jgi:hypothetical protein
VKDHDHTEAQNGDSDGENPEEKSKFAICPEALARTAEQLASNELVIEKLKRQRVLARQKQANFPPVS